MPEIVTANEIAKDLGVDPKRLRRWLRAQKESGHALLGGHLVYARWEFPRTDAGDLALRMSRQHDRAARKRLGGSA